VHKAITAMNQSANKYCYGGPLAPDNTHWVTFATAFMHSFVYSGKGLVTHHLF
jgi:hypothetical protein